MSLLIQIIGMVSHYLLPLLSISIVFFTTLSLFKVRQRFSFFILTEDSKRIALTEKNTLIGSSDVSDIRFSGVMPEHAVITTKNNFVTIRPLKGMKILINNKEINKETVVEPYDVISAGKREFSIRRKAIGETEQKNSNFHTISMFSLFSLQLLLLPQFYFNCGLYVLALFFAFIVFEIIYFAIITPKRAKVEILVLFLITLGFSVVSPMGFSVLLKQIICFAIGLTLAVLIYFAFFSQKFVKFLKVIAIVAAVGLFCANVMIGVIYNGSQNWIEIGNFSFQPSEFVKIILVFLSAATAEKIAKKYNTVGYTVFVGFSLCILAYLRDFGTAFVYVVVFLVVIMLRNSRWRVFFAYIFGGGIMMGIISLLLPYISKRLFSFGHAWENAFSTGYQQTRTIIAAASGGLLGVGNSNGFLRKITSFDTDIVFGLICEELGIITGVCAVIVFVILALYAVKLFDYASPFYAIPACTAATVFLAQTLLNVFGSIDMLPFTGVTLPFISNGGSSLICCVALIAFFKAAEREAKKLL